MTPLRTAALCIVIGAAVPAQAERPVELMTLTVENDLFVNEDNGYTNGTYLSWAHGGFEQFDGDTIPRWLHALTRDLPISTAPDRHRGVSYLIGQAMQTPGDLTRRDLIEDDLPYMGVLLWQASLHAWNDRVADELTLMLGMAGPAAGARHTQKSVHRITGSDDPKGWSHQIHNEPVFRVGIERLWRLADVDIGHGLGADLIGIGNAGAGTLQSSVGTGLSLRLGRGLDRSFPTATVVPGREVNPMAGSSGSSWSVFVNVLGSYVANELGVDGNTFRDSHAQALEHWQGQVVAGVAVGWEHWGLLLSGVHASDRYQGQAESGRFGSLSITYSY